MRSPEQREALRDALLEAVEATRDAGRPGETPRGPRTRTSGAAWGALVGGMALLAWIWTARPTWVFGAPPAPPTAAVVAARARYAIYIQRTRVEEHLQRVGRLPGTLAELGADPGVPVTLHAMPDGSYELRAEVDGAPIVFGSRMNADSFLGDALQTLRARR